MSTIRLVAIGSLAVGAVCVVTSCSTTKTQGVVALDMFGQHAQSATLRAGDLEKFQFFFGAIDANGDLKPSSIAGSDPTKDIIPGELSGEVAAPRGEKFNVTRVNRDPCVPYGALKEGSNLPVYRVRDERGQNPCLKQDNDVVDEDELAACEGATTQEKIDSANSLNGLAVAVAGYWDKDGIQQKRLPGSDVRPVVTLACISGIVAKCAHWGYLPWGESKDGTQLSEYHVACVHAARAAYGSKDGPNVTAASQTCEGTVVDIFDRIGIQAEKGKLEPESYWGVDGKLCLLRPRFKCSEVYFKPDGKACDGVLSNRKWLIGIRSGQHDLYNPSRCPGREEDACDYL